MSFQIRIAVINVSIIYLVIFIISLIAIKVIKTMALKIQYKILKPIFNLIIKKCNQRFRGGHGRRVLGGGKHNSSVSSYCIKFLEDLYSYFRRYDLLK
jgi:hypothetical protein